MLVDGKKLPTRNSRVYPTTKQNIQGPSNSDIKANGLAVYERLTSILLLYEASARSRRIHDILRSKSSQSRLERNGIDKDNVIQNSLRLVGSCPSVG